MLIDLTQQPVDRPLSVDICIVGGGPAGLSMAARYIGTGRSVAVLESGFSEPHEATQMLNLAWGTGPMIRHQPFYLATSRLRGLGGSQHGWGGWCTPLVELDLEQRDWVAHSGWPISMSQLVPYYEQAAAICGLHAATARPQPDCRVFGGELTERRYYFTPARRTASETLQQDLTDAENITIYLGANVTSLECEPSQTRVTTVCARTLEGSALQVTPKFIVLAAGGVENARLLLAAGLGNRHDLVGRFFMEHPHIPIGSVELPRSPQWERYMGRTSPELGHGAMWTFAVPPDVQRTRRLLNATVQLWPGGEQQPPDGKVLRAQLLLRAEQSPNPDSRVTLGDYPDALGVPVARLDWDFNSRDWESVCTTAELVGSALTRHAGGRVALTVLPGAPWPVLPPNADHYNAWGCHHIGTTRMSDDPRAGVVDPDTCVHGMENLFVAGSSIFPTAGYANPTFTLIALALRTADHLDGLL